MLPESTPPDTDKLRADLAARKQQLSVESDADMRALLHQKIAALEADITALAARASTTNSVDDNKGIAIQGGTVQGPVVQGDYREGDEIERQIKQGTGSLYVEGNFVLPPGSDKDPAEVDLRRQYLNRLMTQLNRVKLASSDEAAARMKLSSVYTALLSSNVYLPGERRKEVPADVARREGLKISLLEELNDARHLVILGGPGSGKSTFANFVVLCLAGEWLRSPHANLAVLTRPLPQDSRQRRRNKDEKPEPQPWAHGALLPVLAELRDFAETLPAPGTQLDEALLERFILDHTSPADYRPYLKKALGKPGVLVILDGLDEVPDANRRREQVKQAVHDFVSLHADCRVLVTSRTYAYQTQAWRLDGFTPVEIAPLEPPQVNAFVDAWYYHLAESSVGRLSETDARGKAAHLKNRIANDGRIQELTERPLLLTLIARLHLDNQGDLPSERELIYRDSVKLLLNDWERQKLRQRPDGAYEATQPSLTEYLKVNNDELQKMLQALAFEAHSDQTDPNGPANIARDKLELSLLRLARNDKANPIELEAYLRDRAGILVSHANDTYQFPHRTFQEYLAARHMAIAPEYPQPLCGLTVRDPNRWREALMLVAARNAIDSPLGLWALIEELCPDEPPQTTETPASEALWGAALAGQALRETGYASRDDVAAINRRKRDRVRHWMRAIVERGLMTPFERAQAGIALSDLGDPRREVLDVDAMQFVPIPAGTFWMGSPESDEDGYGDERPRHQQKIARDYRMAKYPVTVRQWRQFREAADRYGQDEWWAGLAAPDDHRSSVEEPSFDHANHPAHNVSWYEAVAFSRWLTARWRASGKIKASEEVRLPSEAEWERAARGPEGEEETYRSRPWGNELTGEHANYDQTGIGQTSAVGCFPKGRVSWGEEALEEMIGNVWEWTTTKWTDDYADYAPDDDLGGTEGRVLRGGSWFDHHRYARCACRSRLFGPSARGDRIGFRLVVSPT